MGVEKCALCQSKCREKILEKRIKTYVKCINCDLIYLDKIPKDLNDIYGEEYRLGTKEDDQQHFNYRKERFGKERVRDLERYCGSLGCLRLLDVGCGNGFFLAAAKSSFGHLAGAEFSKQMREKAHINTGLEIYDEPLNDFPEKGFDIITAFNVIEHVEKPGCFIESACDLLNNRGYLYLYTPNYDSLSVKVLQGHSPILDVEHLCLFNHAALKKLGEMFDLDIVNIETRGMDMSTIIAFQQYLDKKENDFLLTWSNELQAIIDFAGVADGLRVLYKKGS